MKAITLGVISTLFLFFLPNSIQSRILHLKRRKMTIPVIDMSPPRPRKLKFKSYIDSGSIKLGEGDYFDPSGKRIKEKPKTMEEVEPPTMKDDKDNQPAMLQLPNTFMAEDWKKQKPVIFVPEVIYPNIKKRIIMHHYAPMMQVFRNQVFHSLFYQSFLKNNPFYKDVLKDNDYQKNLESNPYFKGFLDNLHKQWKY